MDIVMLAAGTSSRMGKINKMLLPYKDTVLAAWSCQNAIDYLKTLDESSNLIVVTGYYSGSLVKALKQCIDSVTGCDSRIKLTIVRNADYRKGQFSSTKVGVDLVDSDKPFFITLADMPDIKKENYLALGNKLDGCDAIRPFYKGQPGHPVLIGSRVREAILASPDDNSVSCILKNFVVKEVSFEDDSWIRDIDTPSDV